MAAQDHLHAKAHAQAKLKPKKLRKLLAPVFLAAAVHGSVSLDVGGYLSPSYAV